MDYPYECVDLPFEEAKKTKNFTQFTQVGPKKYLLSTQFKDVAKDFYNLENIRTGDAFVIGFWRSGTTWTQEMVWLLQNNLDLDKANAIGHSQRIQFLDGSLLITPKRKEIVSQLDDHEDFQKTVAKLTRKPSEILKDISSPRTIKTHVPLSLLPPNLLDRAKVVYICRDPRDLLVSEYKMYANLPWVEIEFVNLSEYIEGFITNRTTYSPYFEHVKEAWERRHHPNMLFLFYEELLKDLPGALRRMAKFFNKDLTEEQVAKLCDHLHISNLKKNTQVNEDVTNILLGTRKETSNEFVSKGGSGGWRQYFNEDDTRKVNEWIRKNLQGTDLRYPTFEM